MKQILKNFKIFICVMLVFIMAGCKNDSIIVDSNGEFINGPDEIVPDKVELVENLEANDYTITEYNTIEGSDLTIERVVASKGKKFIDITYGLSSENVNEIFNAYRGIYKEGYYILALNGNYVYCVSDKKTFSKAGFTSTANLGIQYINN